MSAPSSARSTTLAAGLGAFVLLPAVQLAGVYRFALLPQILALHLAAFLCCLHAALDPALRRPSTSVTLPMAGLLSALALSVAQAINPAVSLLPLATNLAYALLFLALVGSLTLSGFRRLALLMAAFSSVISLLGLLQYLGIRFDWLISAAPPGSTLGHRNLAAAYTVGVLPLTAWAMWRSDSERSQLLWGVAAGLQASFLLATRSRGGWVALAVAAIAAGAFLAIARSPGRSGGTRRARRGLWVALLPVVFLALIPAVVEMRVEETEGEAIWQEKQGFGDAVGSILRPGGDKGRLALWKRSLEMFQDQPILGVGIGNWRIVYPAYAKGDLIDSRILPHRPHNEILTLAAESGFLAALCALWLVIATIRSACRSGGQLPLRASLVAVMAATLTSASFSFPREFPATWEPFVVAMVGICILELSECPRPSGGRRALMWWGLPALALGGWITISHVGFDRHALSMRMAFQANDLPTALVAADSALKYGPLDEEAYLIRGASRSAMGRPEQAQVDLEAGLAYHPHHPGLWVGLGEALRQTAQPGRAMGAYRKALRYNPRSGEALNNIGLLHASSGDLDSAAFYLRLAIEDHERDKALPEAFTNLSVVLRLQGDLPGSRETAFEAVRRDPLDPEALNALGSALLANGDAPRAVEVFRKAIEISPDQLELRYNLGVALEQAGRLPDALNAYQTFLEQWPGGEVPRIAKLRKRLSELQRQPVGSAHPDD